MALTPGLNHEQLALSFTDITLDQLASGGSITFEDAALAISLRAVVGIMTTEEVTGIVVEVVDTITNRITGGIGDVLNPIGIGIGDIEDKVKEWIKDALGPIFDAIEEIGRKVAGAVSGTLTSIQNTVAGIGFRVSEGFQRVIAEASEIIDSLEGKILSPILSVLGEALAQIERIDDLVKDVVTTAVAPIIATTNAIIDNVEGFATALRDTLPALGLNIVEGLAQPIGLLNEGIESAAKAILNTFFADISEDVTNRVDAIVEFFEEEARDFPDIAKMFGPAQLSIGAVGGLIAGFALPMIFSNVASTALSPFSEKLRQRMNSLIRPALIGPTDAIQAAQRGFLEPEPANEILSKHGLPQTQIAPLFELLKQRPGTVDIVDFWRREIITDEEATTELRSLGWDDRYVAIIKEAAFPPPGVSDLIRMAVREVFSPEIAEQFGQFEEIPEAYLKWAKQVGLTTEWATNFWAAHWVLPSVQQGFQMLHRGVITDEDLERLFVALDVMPFWRANIKAISFRPFTRVDVRRMFSLGILDRAGVKRAYQDLGFDNDKAESMTEFTVRWVESTRKVEKDKERDLTKGDIIGLFNDGLLTEEVANGHLRTMGFSADEAELLIQREIVQELRQDRKADISLIVDQAKIKVLTFQEAQDRLNGLDLTRKEMERATIDVTRATSQRTRLPSKGDLDEWVQLELISLDQYTNELDNLGFPAKYVSLYTEAIQLETADDLLAAEEREARKAEPRPITKGNLDSLLRTEIIDIDEYQTGLETLRFDETAINRFVEQIIVEIEERRIADEARIARGEEAADKERLLSRVVLGKLLIKGIIQFPAYEEGLRQLGFSPESIELLVRLIRQKIEAAAEN